MHRFYFSQLDHGRIDIIGRKGDIFYDNIALAIYFSYHAAITLKKITVITDYRQKNSGIK